MASPRYYFSDKLAARRSRRVKLLLALVFILAVSAGSAWSHESFGDADAMPASYSPPLSETDSCLPLLKSVRHVSPDTVTDKTQRSAGKMAALGFIFGVRFALGPVEVPGHSQGSARVVADIRTPSGDRDGRNALATLAYRHCRKGEALSALASVRPGL